MIKTARIALAAIVYVPLLMSLSRNALAQCAPDPNGAGAICPAPGPVPVCAPPLPGPGLCPIDTLGFTNQSTLSWVGPVAPCAAVFDLVRGDVDCLRASQAPVPSTCVVGFTSAGVSCLLGPPPDVDLDIPAIGEGYWYSVRVNPAFCGAT